METVKKKLAASIGTSVMNDRVILMVEKSTPTRLMETSQFEALG